MNTSFCMNFITTKERIFLYAIEKREHKNSVRPLSKRVTITTEFSGGVYFATALRCIYSGWTIIEVGASSHSRRMWTIVRTDHLQSNSSIPREEEKWLTEAELTYLGQAKTETIFLTVKSCCKLLTLIFSSGRFVYCILEVRNTTPKRHQSIVLYGN